MDLSLPPLCEGGGGVYDGFHRVSGVKEESTRRIVDFLLIGLGQGGGSGLYGGAVYSHRTG